MIDTQLIFPTKVYRSHFNEAQELQKSVVPTFLEQEKKDPSPVKYSANGYTSYGVNSDVLNMPQLGGLKSFLDTVIDKCHEESKLNGKPKLESSWFSINRKFTYHEEHHHMPSVWSGVYYVQADQDHPGLTLVNTNQKTHWPRTGVTQLTESNSPEVTCVATTGTVIIFPSYLLHKVNQQMVDKERITVAFNYGI
tara:strand:+ start:2609 stop:3193 length:585 start_codon:yes stop_codon:yes gene_type:complete